MGMTIDLALDIFKHPTDYFPSEREEAWDFALSTMCKYQRIQAIVKEWREVGLDYDSCDAMDNIERVIEDGKV